MNRIIQTVNDIPQNSAFTLAEWQAFEDKLRTLTPEQMNNLRDFLSFRQAMEKIGVRVYRLKAKKPSDKPLIDF